MGGFESPAATNVIEYVEIATTGNAVDFGDADSGTIQSAGGVSNGRGLNISMEYPSLIRL